MNEGLPQSHVEYYVNRVSNFSVFSFTDCVVAGAKKAVYICSDDQPGILDKVMFRGKDSFREWKADAGIFGLRSLARPGELIIDFDELQDGGTYACSLAVLRRLRDLQ